MQLSVVIRVDLPHVCWIAKLDSLLYCCHAGFFTGHKKESMFKVWIHVPPTTYLYA